MNRGMSLASVLMIISIAAVIAFTMAAVGTSHLNRAQRHAAALDAMDLAEAAVAETISSLHSNNRFGLASEEVKVQPDPTDATRYGRVTFDAAGQTFSTNNYAGMAPLNGWGGAVVPGGNVHVVAVGTSHDVTSTIEVVVGVPQFPYVIAVAGGLQSQGGLLVTGPVTSPGAAPAEASVASNDNIQVASSAEVTGDVIARGTVSLPPDAVIGGQVRNDTVDLPNIDLSQFDTSQRVGATVVADSPGGPLTVNGMTYTQANLTVGGDLTVNGLLYVKGSLTVNGAIKGQGGVVVRGPTTVTGGIALHGATPAQAAGTSASNMVALLSDGDVNLSASSTASYFEGLVYTHGNFTAANITVLGTFVANPPTATPGGSAGSMNLDNVVVAQVPQASKLKVTLGTSDPAAAAAAADLLSAGNVAIATSQTFNTPVTAEIQVDSQAFTDSSYHTVQSSSRSGDRNTIIQALRPAFTGHPWYFGGTDDSALNSGHGNLYEGRVYLPLQKNQPNGFHLLALEVPLVQRVDNSGTFSTTTTSGQNLNVAFHLEDGPTGRKGLNRQSATDIAAAEGVSLDAMIQSSVDLQNFAVVQANAMMQHYRDTGVIGPGNTVDFDLNKFLRDTMPMSVLSWRQR